MFEKSTWGIKDPKYFKLNIDLQGMVTIAT
jgi:hypothetical protein